MNLFSFNYSTNSLSKREKLKFRWRLNFEAGPERTGRGIRAIRSQLSLCTMLSESHCSMHCCVKSIGYGKSAR